ncbi:class I SAM-dependent methyltransferase [Cypionkella sp.]|uniref:class I SAM-dependent methyltransferase n=1 Tax=Cypionkella sp. TaxID=2811411 RepID=UPI00262E2B56|nr:class I SAM-dependent methyltransferase [Cypionkella sp.]MDB5664475.1 class SAM-dependent methyltransferase [Cypionkella sp.]
MQPDLPSLTRICQTEEAALRAIFSDIALTFAPPFTPKIRFKIAHLLDLAEPHRHALQRAHSFHLQSPELRALPMHAPERQYFDAVLRHLRLYPAALARLQTALRQRLPLFPPAPPPYTPEAQTLALHSRTWDHMHSHLSPHPPNLYHDAPGHHGDLPYPTTDFLRYAMAARRICLAMDKHAPAFLDVGCGVGLKVFQAAELFARADGLEYEPDHAAAGQAMMQRGGWPSAQIFHADALTFPHYGDYDVLYVYKPMYGEPLEQMERHLTTQASPGTLLIAPYLDFTTRFETLGCTRIENFLYMIRPLKTLPAILKRAVQVGCALPARPKNGYAEDGFLNPLHLALRRWGHGD